MKSEKLVSKWFKSWKTAYGLRRRRDTQVGGQQLLTPTVLRTSSRRSRLANPVWAATNREYGISDMELLDHILCQKYNVQVEPPSAALETVFQIPDTLAIPFQRKLYVRLHKLGGVFDITRNRTRPFFYVAGQKNITSSVLRGHMTEMAGFAVRRAPKPLLWNDRSLEFVYFPPSHHMAAFGKTRPIVQIVDHLLVSLAKRDRFEHHKSIKAALFEEYCKVQGITREIQRWADVSLNVMDDLDHLSFLLKDDRHPSLIRAEIEAMEQGGEYDEHESFLVKRSSRHIKGIDGVYMFRPRRHHKPDQAQLREKMELAVQSVIYEYGYVDPEFAASAQVENLTAAEQVAFARTTSPVKKWVYERNAQFIRAFESTTIHPTNDDEWNHLAKHAMDVVYLSQTEYETHVKQ
ncbi:hypothetical protein V1512DRAFT_263548 [Lipomyces arxii]|uniref:uncharacterized protein n=1 Tax=Lipomyces arxii TaxID=56418 RepID=UPI0034CDDFEE